MWERIKMIFRSLFGGAVRRAEDPELILRQYMDDLRARVPELNDQVREVLKLRHMLEMQTERLEEKVEKLDRNVVAAVKAGEEHKEAAKTLIAALETARTELVETQLQLEQARENSQRAMKMRETYEKRIRQQISEAMQQIARAKRAKMEEEVASVMMAFEVGDSTEVLERMTEQIDERLARARAGTELAATDLDTELFDVEAVAIEQQAEAKYVEYQRQLGLIPEEEAGERTMEPVAESETQQEPPAVETETETEEN